MPILDQACEAAKTFTPLSLKPKSTIFSAAPNPKWLRVTDFPK